MGLLHPELLLLLVPVLLMWWRFRDATPATRIVRLLVALLLLLALAGPYLRTVADGRDLVVVVDRSRSMPPGSDAAALELIRLAEEERGSGDRVAVVAFGQGARIEQIPSPDARFAGFVHDLDTDGSDLAGALETALHLVPDGRPGTVLLVSDGEHHGRDPLPEARRAFARGIPVDVRALPRSREADLSVEQIALPGQVEPNEPFQFTVWVRSDRAVTSSFTLERRGTVIATGERSFEPGLQRLVFRDVLPTAGVMDYRLRLTHPDDRVPENNQGVGAVLVTGSRSILVVNDDGAEDTLVRALRAAELPVLVASPEGAALDAVALTAHRAVVLENVAAGRLAAHLDALRDFVLERGGGLLVTGGRASFGVGGYFKSRLDELLPVSMEVRQEHRKQAVALAIAMDRSGSMSAPVTATLRKMDLANLGAAAAIELLTPIDAVGVIAVDSSAHTIQALTQVDDPGALVSRVRRIESMGGGIFTYTALLAAGKMLENAEQINRHIILFADAADSEEQEKCPELIERLGQMGVTISVIALGSPTDSDAEFLRTVAAQGGGDVYFSNDPNDLPRLFAQDTLKAARASFVEQPTPATALADLFALGEMPGGGFPTVEGYNLTYLRPGANVGVKTDDEYQAPLLAFWYQGLGRAAAYTGQIGGQLGQSVVGWEGFATLFVTLTRWLAGQEEPEAFFPSVRREGRDAVIAVDVDPAAPVPPDTSRLEARIRSPAGELISLPLERVAEHRFEARHPVDREGIAIGTLRLGDDRFVTLPPIVVPYSPEFERSANPERGTRLLKTLARESGGLVEPTAADLFRGEREGKAYRLVTRELTLAALLLLLIEIAGRRLQLWGSLRIPPRLLTALRRLLRAPLARFLPALERLRRSRQRLAPRMRPEDDEPEAEPETAPPPSPEVTPDAKPAMSSALRRAKRSSSRRLDR